MRINKNSITIMSAMALLGISSLSYGIDEGFYLGGQVGKTNIHNKPATFPTNTGGTVTVNPNNTGFGGRAFLGYQFNPFAGMEFGYIHYASTTYHTPNTVTVCGNPAIRENAIDLLAKGTYPFSTTGFGLEGKAGVSFLRKSSSGSLATNSSNGVAGCSSSSNQTTTTARPEIGIGVSYDITDSWQVDLTANRVLGGGSVQSADFYAVGISYHWVTKKCGQFIC